MLPYMQCSTHCRWLTMYVSCPMWWHGIAVHCSVVQINWNPFFHIFICGQYFSNPKLPIMLVVRSVSSLPRGVPLNSITSRGAPDRPPSVNFCRGTFVKTVLAVAADARARVTAYGVVHPKKSTSRYQFNVPCALGIRAVVASQAESVTLARLSIIFKGRSID